MGFYRQRRTCSDFSSQESFSRIRHWGEGKAKVGDTGEQHSGFVIEEPPVPPGTWSRVHCTRDSQWILQFESFEQRLCNTLKRHIYRFGTAIFCCGCWCNGIFGFWVGTFYGWGVIIMEKIQNM